MDTSACEDYDAFGYCWTRSNGEFYYGIHRGHVDDKYKGSGAIFKDKFKGSDRSEWNRTVEFKGTWEECKEWEADIVNDELLAQPNCLNVVRGGGEAVLHSAANKKRCAYWAGKKLSKEHIQKATKHFKGALNPRAQLLNIYEVATDKLIAEGVVSSLWCRDNDYNCLCVSRTARADMSKPSSRHNRLNHKGIYARYVDIKMESP